MADVKWIKLQVDIFNNRKIKQIRSMPAGNDILLMWFQLMCLAGNINDRGQVYITPEIPYTEKTLATEFGLSLDTVRIGLQVFEQFGMIEVVDDILRLSSWEKYQSVDGLEKIREQNRIRVARHREKKKLEMLSNVTETLPVTQGNDIDKNKIREDKNKDINTLFEELWKMYPNKRGKGQISDTKKQKLFEIGKEHMERAVTRYLDDLKLDTWRKPQNGSTFFNSGYTAYEQRTDVDYDKIQAMLENKGVKSN